MRWFLNLVMPGCGLVWVGRLVWGLVLAVLFAPAAGVLALAWLVAPQALPPAAVAVAAGVAGGAFVAAQVLLLQDYRLRNDEAWRHHVAALEESAREYFEAGNPFEALLAVEELLEVNPDDLEAHLLKARILAADGKYARAAEAYRRLERVDVHGVHRREVAEALARYEPQPAGSE